MVGPLPEYPLQAEVVAVDALPVPLPHGHEFRARSVGEVRPGEGLEEGRADVGPQHGRAAALDREVVPEGGIAVEGDGEDADESVDGDGVVGAADAIEPSEVGDRALRRLAAKDGKRRHVDVGGLDRVGRVQGAGIRAGSEFGLIYGVGVLPTIGAGAGRQGIRRGGLVLRVPGDGGRGRRGTAAVLPAAVRWSRR